MTAAQKPGFRRVAVSQITTILWPGTRDFAGRCGWTAAESTAQQPNRRTQAHTRHTGTAWIAGITSTAATRIDARIPLGALIFHRGRACSSVIPIDSLTSSDEESIDRNTLGARCFGGRATNCSEPLRRRSVDAHRPGAASGDHLDTMVSPERGPEAISKTDLPHGSRSKPPWTPRSMTSKAPIYQVVSASPTNVGSRAATAIPTAIPPHLFAGVSVEIEYKQFAHRNG